MSVEQSFGTNSNIEKEVSPEVLESARARVQEVLGVQGFKEIEKKMTDENMQLQSGHMSVEIGGPHIGGTRFFRIDFGPMPHETLAEHLSQELAKQPEFSPERVVIKKSELDIFAKYPHLPEGNNVWSITHAYKHPGEE